MFFEGLLGWNVRADWDTSEDVVQADDLGVLGNPRPGRADIFLNAKTVLLDHARPLEAMFTAILHEMCVSEVQSLLGESFSL